MSATRNKPLPDAIIKVPKQSLGENLGVLQQELGNEIKRSVAQAFQPVLGAG
jgi:hypothetical protein